VRIDGGPGGFAERTVSLQDLAWVIVAAEEVRERGGTLDEERVNRLRYGEETTKGSARWIDTGWALAAWNIAKDLVLDPVPSRVHGPDGKPLDATFRLERVGNAMTIVFESRGGTRGSAAERNVDYNQGLELILDRLGKLGIAIADVLVESKTTANLTPEERRVHVEGERLPIVVTNAAALRKKLSAAQARVGRAEGAKGGGNQTKRIRLYLTEASARLAAGELLRALEQREIQPIGGRVRAIDVRLIAATDTDLDEAVAAGRFRKALLFRLCGQTLKLLPLRDRPADIAVQLVHFLRQALDGLGKPERLRLRSWTDPPWLDLAAVEHALLARWPGNSRELRGVAGQAALLRVNKSRLVLAIGSTSAPAPAPVNQAEAEQAAADDGEPPRSLTESAIRRALTAHQFSVRGAARALQVAPNTLYARMDDLGIPRAGALTDEALAAAHAASGGDLLEMARALGVSLRGLKRRLGRTE
jgi:transcriptional regulator of acetoin/glycerol metabolism